MKSIEIEVKGMHCASCVAAVEKSIAKVPGVQKVAVNLATESASVEFADGEDLFDDIRKAVESAGYQVTGRSDHETASVLE